MKTQPYVRPSRQPFEEVYVSYKDGDVFIHKPRQGQRIKLTRLCLPAELDKLRVWNQLGSTKWHGNPWGYDSIGFSHRCCRLPTMLVSTGADVYIADPNGAWGRTWYGVRMIRRLCNWVHDKANKKFSYEFQIKNEREETDPIVIFDDGGVAFWNGIEAWAAGTIGLPSLSDDTVEKVKGTDSLKIVVGSGTAGYWKIYHDYTTDQNWSAKEFICLYLYGSNDGKDFRVVVCTIANDYSNYAYYTIPDNFTGWKRFVLPIKKFSVGSGSPDWSRVRRIELRSAKVDKSGTFYLDRAVVDVGQWAQMEVFVPDILRNLETDGTIFMHSWDGASWRFFVRWNPYHTTWTSPDWYEDDNLFFLDGTKMVNVAAAHRGFGFYRIGQRSETKSNIWGGPGTITYSGYYGCKKRIAFAIRMPPRSDTNIHKTKLKLEVYYEGDLAVGDTWGDNHGTRYGSQPVAGKVGMALDFDGKGDYVEVPDSPSLNFDLAESFSLEAWFKLSSLPTTSWYAILSKYGAGQGAGYNDLYALYIDTDGKIRFSVRDSAGNNPVVIGSTLTIDTWYHVVGVRDTEKDEIRLYLNGILNATPVTDTTVDDISSPRPLLIGNQEHYIAGAAPTLPFHGVIDEARIYNRALSATEVQDLYSGKRITDGLVSEWGFEDDPHFGQTTYEFADSTDVFYGLRQINNSWLALFNPTENVLEYLILNRRPIGLEVTADHDKNISEIKFKLRKGTRIWLGELMHADFSRDTDGDGVPDIFEEDYDPSIVLDIDFNNEDETQNIAHDRSPNHNNGTIYGAKWVDGKVGRALQFDGVDDYVDVADSTSLRFGTGNHAIEGWFKTTATSGMIFAKSINYKQECIWVRLYGGQLHLKWWDSPDPSREILSGLVNDGKWHHFVAQRSGNTVYGFLDGNQFGSSAVGADATFDAVGYVNRIGAENTAGGQPFDGVIDEIRIYNRALTADEIKERYNLGKLKRVSVPRLVKRMGYAGW